MNLRGSLSRYLDWRDQRSSSRTLGFRIEGTYQDNHARKDFKSVKSAEDVMAVLEKFIKNDNIKVSWQIGLLGQLIESF